MTSVFEYEDWEEILDRGTMGEYCWDIMASWKNEREREEKRLYEELEELLALARTSLKPDIYTTEEEWINHKINKIAAKLNHILGK